MKNFDLNYKLDQFRKERLSDLFDENGKKYTGVGISNYECEMMLELINELEKEVLKLELGNKNCATCANNICKNNPISKDCYDDLANYEEQLHFNKSVEPAIRYLLQNHSPHTSIYIHYDTAELLSGERTHNLSRDIPD